MLAILLRPLVRPLRLDNLLLCALFGPSQGYEDLSHACLDVAMQSLFCLHLAHPEFLASSTSFSLLSHIMIPS